MPDRDAFSRVQRAAARACRHILASLQGEEELEPDRIVRPLELLWRRIGGSSAFALWLRRLDESREPQQRLPLAGLADELAAIGRSGSRIDMLVERAAARTGFIMSDRDSAAYGFVRELMRHVLLEARDGVIAELGAAEYLKVEARIEEMLTPVVERVSAALLANPERRTLGLCAEDPVSDAENLL